LVSGRGTGEKREESKGPKRKIGLVPKRKVGTVPGVGKKKKEYRRSRRRDEEASNKSGGEGEGTLDQTPIIPGGINGGNRGLRRRTRKGRLCQELCLILAREGGVLKRRGGLKRNVLKGLGGKNVRKNLKIMLGAGPVGTGDAFRPQHQSRDF